jgi:mRNA interferase RelE/StbE
VTHPLRIHWLDSARFEVRKLQQPLAMRVFEAVLHFAQSGQGDIKPLHGKLADAFRLRVGEYRVLFTLEDGAMRIFGVRHRSEAYRQ